MTVVIDPNFSVYRLLERNIQQNFSVRHRETMRQISYEIENSAAVSLGKTRLFAGFQRLSHFIPQIERYRAMAPSMEGIYVFGIPDVEPPPINKIHYLLLSPEDMLSHEWFVVSYGPGYSSAVGTEEVSAPSTQEHDRIFKGVWTFNPFIVSIIGNWISRAIDVPEIKWEIDELLHRQHLHRMVESIDHLIGQIDVNDQGSLATRRALLRQELTETLRGELQSSHPPVKSTP